MNFFHGATHVGVEWIFGSFNRLAFGIDRPSLVEQHQLFSLL